MKTTALIAGVLLIQAASAQDVAPASAGDGASQTHAPASRVAPSTTEMARELARIGARFDDDLIAQRPEMHFSRFRRYLAVSYLRLGEQENCLCQRGVDSCLLPIRGQGVHTRQEGSRAAIVEFTEMLKADPGDLTIP